MNEVEEKLDALNGYHTPESLINDGLDGLQKYLHK